MDVLLEPFQYSYMLNAMWVSALIGGVCAFLSCYLILKGWSLIGDALSHSIVPGVAGAYMIGLPFSFGAFLSGGLAATGMLFLSQQSKLKEDAIIGLIFTSFFGLGLFFVSLFPTSVNIQTIVMGNILAITPTDTLQIVLIGCTSLLLLIIKWRDFMVVFFDENHAKTIGLSPNLLKVLFFSILSACTVAALQTVGAFLVIAMVVIPGATAYLLSDRFSTIIILSMFIGVISALLGAYLSYFINGATGGIIVLLQTVFFISAFFFAPKYGKLATYKKSKQALKQSPFFTDKQQGMNNG
ncbi:metal ABC transporter permease [Photobacterium leiognathi]|uniref:metal ABC transporter permease n=1 Tax=Photobacterium leiognathi TaxID=553611 RepID=UPI0027362B75|nr:metal ABC transporter permease [Photobacterium leiognathi]